MRQALEMALEALQTLHDENMDYLTRNKLGGENNQCMVFARETITAIKEALAQEQEPLTENGMYRLGYHNGYGFGEAYGKTNAPQRTWVGLTDDEILDVNMSTVTKLIDEPIVCDTDHNIIQLGKAIEAKLKERNT